MGRQAYPIIGGIIGAVVTWYAGGTGYAAGYAIGAAIGGIVGSYADPLIIQGNTIGDSAMQTAAEGGARAIMLGKCCVTATCVIARGNRQITENQSGGKGSSDDGSTVNQSVHWTFAIGLGEAIVGSHVTRIWQDETLVYDISGGSSISVSDNNAFAAKFRFYDGNETQLPDPDLQVFLNDDTPYFRGTAYVVFPNFDLTNTAERVPAFRFEVSHYTVADQLIADLKGLSIYVPTTTGQGNQSNPVTLHGSVSVNYDISIFVIGDMETRGYLHVNERIGGKGRFVTTTDRDSSSVPDSANAYFFQVTDPATEFYWMNSFLPHQTLQTRFKPDGGDDYEIRTTVRGGSTPYFNFRPGDSEFGNSIYAPQYVNVKTAKVHSASDGSDPNSVTIELATIASILLDRVGIASYDVSALTDQVAGVCIQSTVTGADALNACIQPFFADPCEKDGVLTWVKRGAAVVRTLTIDDLTEEPDSASRENSIEYPAKLHFFYQSPTTGYASTKATSYRYSPQADSSGEGSVTSPITFENSDVPEQIAQKLHKTMWTEADGSFQWKVGMQCIDLLPTDVVGLDLRGIVTRARIIGTESDNSTIVLTMMKDRQSNIDSVVTGIPLSTPTPPQPASTSLSALAIMDIPALQDGDDQLCYYVSMQGLSSSWSGAELQRSFDGGANWAVVSRVTTKGIMGKLTAPLGWWYPEITDTVNSIEVLLFDPTAELISYTDTQFLQEQGAVAVQCDDGTWEIVQYRDAVDNGGGSWTLSYLQRGRLNTPATTVTHSEDALFVVLNSSLLTKVPAEIAWIGASLMHRAVSYGTSAEDASIVETDFIGNSQIEWSPAGANADYDGQFVYVHGITPRHRFGTEVLPVASVNFQGYRVTLFDAGTDFMEVTVLTDSVHIDASTLGGTVTYMTIQEINKITGGGTPFYPVINRVPDGSLTPVAIINGGGD